MSGLDKTTATNNNNNKGKKRGPGRDSTSGLPPVITWPEQVLYQYEQSGKKNNNNSGRNKQEMIAPTNVTVVRQSSHTAFETTKAKANVNVNVRGSTSNKLERRTKITSSSSESTSENEEEDSNHDVSTDGNGNNASNNSSVNRRKATDANVTQFIILVSILFSLQLCMIFNSYYVTFILYHRLLKC